MRVILQKNLYLTALVFGVGVFFFLFSPAPVHARATLYSSGCYKLGDVDNNGDINANDRAAILFISVALGGSAIDTLSWQQQRADVNGDSHVDSIDALLVDQYVNLLINSFSGCSPPYQTQQPCNPTGNVYTVDGSRVNRFDALAILEFAAGILNSGLFRVQMEQGDVFNHDHVNFPPITTDATVILQYAQGLINVNQGFGPPTNGTRCPFFYVASTPVSGAPISGTTIAGSVSPALGPSGNTSYFITFGTDGTPGPTYGANLTPNPTSFVRSGTTYDFVSWTGCDSVSGNVCTVSTRVDLKDASNNWTFAKYPVANYVVVTVPDYVIQNLSGPTSVCVGASANYTANTVNIGTGAATSGSTTRATATGGTNTLQDYGVGALGAGASVGHSFGTTWNALGSFSITFRADQNGNVAESNEGNNTASLSVNVINCLPDYVIRNGSGGSSPAITGLTTVCLGSTATYTARTVNVGVAASTAASTTTAALSGGGNLSASSFSVSALAVNGFAGHSTNITWTSAGSWTLTFRADAGGTVAESNEANNTALITITVNNCLPDYVIQNLPVSATVCAGTTSTYTPRTVNVGVGAATSSSTTHAAATGGTNPPQDYSVAPLAAGASVSHSFLTTWTTAGSFTLTFIADNNFNVAESNEGNNTARLTVTVNSCFPDLVVPSSPSLVVNISGGGPLTCGKTVRFTAPVRNQGTVAVPATNPFGASFRISSGSSYNAATSINLGSPPVPVPLNTATTVPVTSNVDWVPAAAGTYTLRVFADYINQVDEGPNEANNTRDYNTINVTCAADFTIQVNPSSQQANATDTKNYSVLVTSLNGFSSNVALTFSSPPTGPGITYSSFSPATITGGAGSSTFTVSTNATPIGTYPFTVRGTSGVLTHLASADLEVADQPWFRTDRGDIGSRSNVNINKTGALFVETQYLGISDFNIDPLNFQSAKSWVIQNYDSYGDINLTVGGINLTGSSLYDTLYQKFSSKCTGNIPTFSTSSPSNTTISNAVTSGCKVVRYSGVTYPVNLNLSGSYSGNSAIVFVRGEINIGSSFSIVADKGLIFVADGNIRVAANNIDGVYFASGTFETKSVGCNAYSGTDSPLTINGSVYAFGRVCLNRTLANNSNPAEIINFAPRYLYLFREIVGESKSLFLEEAP